MARWQASNLPADLGSLMQSVCSLDVLAKPEEYEAIYDNRTDDLEHPAPP